MTEKGWFSGKIFYTVVRKKMSEYTCLCCGYISLHSEVHDICPICWWQDDPGCWDDLDAVWGANGISLKQAQKNFIEFGACEEHMLDMVRAPSEDDVKDPDWKLFTINNNR